MLKNLMEIVPKLFKILGCARSPLLSSIRDHCNPDNIDPTIQLIKEVINEDVTYQKKALDLRNQRTYAVKVMSYFHALRIAT